LIDIIDPLESETPRKKITIKVWFNTMNITVFNWRQYYFEGDSRPRVFKAKLHPNQGVLPAQTIRDLLVEDRVNLRTVSNIR
jgi:hypothetical protein